MWNETAKIRFSSLSRPADFNGRTRYQHSDFLNKKCIEWCIESGRTTAIDISAEAHSVITNPKNPQTSWVIPRFSNLISIVDWTTSKEIKTIQATPDMTFYGHLVFIKETNRAFASAARFRDGKRSAVIVELDTNQLEIVSYRDLPIGQSHDLLQLNSTSLLISSISQSSNSNAIYEYNFKEDVWTPLTFSGFDSNPNWQSNYSLVHFLQLNDRIFANAHILDGPAPFNLGTATISEIKASEKSFSFFNPFSTPLASSELLSFAADSKNNRIWVTVPTELLVLVWDLNSNSLVAKIKSKGLVTFISAVPQLNAMLLGISGGFKFVDLTTFEDRTDLIVPTEIQTLSKYYVAHSETLSNRSLIAKCA